MTRRAEGERGYALVAVLWASILLSVMAAALTSQARFFARIESNEWRRLEIETFAEAATAIALHSLLNAAAPSPPILAGARLTGEWEGTPFDYAFEEETGKIDLNEVDVETLARAFRSVGRSAEESAALASAIIAWRAPEGTRRADAPPIFRRFQSVAELMLVGGIDAELFQRLAPTLTVHAQTAVTNPDYASKGTLRALYPGEQAKIDALLAQRKLATEIAVREFRRGAGASQTNLNGRAIAVRVFFQMDGKDREFQTIVRVTGSAQRPYIVLSRERRR
jgi:general secretion pathway protein K